MPQIKLLPIDDKINRFWERLDLVTKRSILAMDIENTGDVYTPHPIDPFPNDIENIFCRELEISITKNRIQFRYINRESNSKYEPGNELLDNIQYMLDYKEILNGRPLDPERDHSWIQGANRNRPSWMSLNIRRKSLVIFLLNAPKNINFARYGTPLSVSEQWAPKEDKYVLGGVKVDPSGDSHDPDNPYAVKNCKIAYMLVDPKQYSDQEFEFPFNIHVEASDFGGQQERPIPIIIDPDIRNPGGSGGG